MFPAADLRLWRRSAGTSANITEFRRPRGGAGRGSAHRRATRRTWKAPMRSSCRFAQRLHDSHHLWASGFGRGHPPAARWSSACAGLQMLGTRSRSRQCRERRPPARPLGLCPWHVNAAGQGGLPGGLRFPPRAMPCAATRSTRPPAPWMGQRAPVMTRSETEPSVGSGERVVWGTNLQGCSTRRVPPYRPGPPARAQGPFDAWGVHVAYDLEASLEAWRRGPGEPQSIGRVTAFSLAFRAYDYV